MSTNDSNISLFLITTGIIMYTCGIFGNILNICVFTIWSYSKQRNNENNLNTRTSNSPLYLLASSWANFILIIYPLLTRIIFDGFQAFPSARNEILICKLRFYILHTSDLISLFCICMAMLDRYLISSREVRLRRLSTTRKQTKLIILLIIFLVGLHNIPIGIYYELEDNGTCIISSKIYLYYYLSIIQIFLHGLFPIIFLSVFGLLTYKQLKRIQRNNNLANFNSDKQLSRMILLLCLAILISSVPYCIGNIYTIISLDFHDRLTSDARIIYYISAIFFFTNSVLSFYIFILSTPNFRLQVKKIFLCQAFARNFQNNQVHTMTSVHNET